MSKILVDAEKKVSVEFQKRLLKLIEEQDCTKKEFADLVGVSLPVITRATIYGIIPTLRMLIKIADYLSVSLKYLLGEIDKENFYMAESQTTFDIRLNLLMKEKNKKYSEIAQTMPFSTNYFYEWHRTGTLPTLDYLRAIAEYFEVSMDYLLGRTDDRN